MDQDEIHSTAHPRNHLALTLDRVQISPDSLRLLLGKMDAARLPVYLVTQWHDIVAIWPLLAITTLGVVVGTVFGTRLLTRLPQKGFRRAIATLLLLLGIYMLIMTLA
jgi:uncharacterized membrane protein YfcA